MQKCMFFATVDVRQNFIISGILHGRRSYKVLCTRQASAAKYRMLENFTRKSNEQQWCPSPLDVSHCVVCVVCHDAAVEFVMVKRPNIESPKMNAIRHFIACTHQTGGGWWWHFNSYAIPTRASVHNRDEKAKSQNKNANEEEKRQ